jgi:tetratricopeptide (TPR) repeat protein
MLNAGIAYAERIYDTVRANEMFESLLSRFPESEVVPEALYLLYRLNRTDNPVKSEAFRQRLLEKYPESEFARILSDPEYYIKKMEEQKQAEKLYSEAYNLYSGEKFNEAISAVDAALKRFPKDILAAKFMLLRAYCVARISDERAFKEELNKLKEAWPGTEEESKADEIIAFLNKSMPELKIEEDRQVAAVLYAVDKNAPHIFALVISDPAFNINLATFDVISYNIDNFTNKNYKTEGSLIENKFILITVSGFADLNEALAYYSSFNSGKYVRNASGAKMINFVISNDNLNVLRTDRNPDRYLQFFQQNYLK